MECSHINELVGQFEKVAIRTSGSEASALMDLPGVCLGDTDSSRDDRRPRPYQWSDFVSRLPRLCFLTPCDSFTLVLERLVRLAAACIKIRNYQYSSVVDQLLFILSGFAMLTMQVRVASFCSCAEVGCQLQ
jgi:hypothetical protein